jgi:hypothetical protein
MVTINEPAAYRYRFNLGNLSDYRSMGIDDEVEVTVNLEKIIHPYWPEAPIDDSTIVVCGREAITAVDLRKRKS